MKPKLYIFKDKLFDNGAIVKRELEDRGIATTFVTKVFSGNKEYFENLDSVGFQYFADARVKNLKNMQSLKTPKMLLRIPMLEELEDLAEVAQASLHSSFTTVERLSRVNKGKSHGVYLMVDVGDLREGYYAQEELMEDVKKILTLKGVHLEGIGTNLTCFAGVLPGDENMKQLTEIKKEIEKTYSVEVKYISGGNSSSLLWAKEGTFPKGINALRLGEGILLGHETATYKPIFDLHRDVFVLEASLVEVKEKPFTPWGEMGKNTFGGDMTVENKIGCRGILALGMVDVDEGLTPVEKDIKILGLSSDHMVVDLGESHSYSLGDVLTFIPDYASLIRLFLSPYVEKILL